MTSACPPPLPSVVNCGCICSAFPSPDELSRTGLSFLWSPLSLPTSPHSLHPTTLTWGSTLWHKQAQNKQKLNNPLHVGLAPSYTPSWRLAAVPGGAKAVGRGCNLHHRPLGAPSPTPGPTGQPQAPLGVDLLAPVKPPQAGNAAGSGAGPSPGSLAQTGES